MDKTSLKNHFGIFVLSLIVLCLISFPSITSAGTLYRCLDQDGNESILDFLVDGQTCKPVQTFEDQESAPRNYKTNSVSGDEKITKIIVRRNQVFVPVTLIYEREEVEVNLLMDTGASATTIHDSVADQLYINLSKTRKARAQVVGGGILETSIVQMDAIKIGPHVLRKKNVMVVPHDGPAVKFDGLLGMDVLGAFGHRIDLGKQVIIWE